MQITICIQVYREITHSDERSRGTRGDGFNHEMVDLKQTKPYPNHFREREFHVWCGRVVSLWPSKLLANL